MATGHLEGAARFRYTPEGGSEIVHLLAVPLSPVRDIRPSSRVARYDWWAWNNIDRETVTVGSRVPELVVTIRLDDDPVGLLAMLEAALDDDLTLVYQLTASGTEFPVRVVEVMDSQGGDLGIVGDRGRFGFGEWEVQVRLRRTDGGSLDGIFADDVES
jgi:hypothetical protein